MGERRLKLLPREYESATAFRQTEWVDLDTITITLVANLLVTLFCVFYFWSMRRHNPDYFSHKRKKVPEHTPPDLPSAGFFGWLRPLVAMRESEILEYAGFDAVILLRFYKLAFKVFAVFSVYGLAVIIPANVQGGLRNSERSKTTINTFNMLSMSNIQHYDSKMWVHALGLWLLSCITMYFLVVEYRFYTSLRHEYLRRKAAHLRTIVVEGVPTDMRYSAKLFTYFNTLYPGNVVSVHAPQDLSHLRQVLSLRLVVVTRLERCLVRKRMRGEEQYHTLGMCGRGQPVNSIEYYEAQLHRLNEAVEREQQRRGARSWRRSVSTQSVSHVDMTFDEVSRAGPIERSVLLTGLGRQSPATLTSAAAAASTYGAGNAILGTDFSGSDADGSEGGFERRSQSVSPVRLPRLWPGKTVTVALNEELGWGQQHDGGPYGNGSNGSHGSGADSPPEAAEASNGRASDSVEAALVAAPPRRSFDMGDMDPLSQALKRAVQKVGATASSAAAAASRKRSWSGFREDERTALLAGQAEAEPVHASRAFVTFKSFGSATVARQVLHCGIPGRMAANAAPEPRDVYWPNIIVSRRQHAMRWLMTELSLGALMLFFPVLVTLISLAVSADNLVSSSEVLKSLCERSTLLESAIELAQPLALITLMSVLPALLRWVGHLEGIISESGNQLVVLSRYFTFQVINVLLVTTIAGSALDVLTRVLNHPSDTFTLLGETLPKVCGFFCDYVIIRTFTGLSMELVRASSFGPACLRIFSFRNLTPRDRRTAVCGLRAYADPGGFCYGQVFAQDLLVVTLVMTYACVAPIILVAGLMFFGYAQIVYRHQLLYVYVPEFESGGAFFPKVFRRFVFAMFCAQATMAGMFLLKNGWHQVYVIFALMALTFVFKMKMREMYEPVAFCLPLELATALDLDRTERGGPPLPGSSDEYLQPEMREPAWLEPELEDPDDFNAMAREAAKAAEQIAANKRLNGGGKLGNGVSAYDKARASSGKSAKALDGTNPA